jgi:hypothetical protein
MDLVDESMHPVHRISFRKLILKFEKIPRLCIFVETPLNFILIMFWSLKFYKSTPELFKIIFLPL